MNANHTSVIKSFVKRNGRTTKSQKQALQHYDDYKLDISTDLTKENLANQFKNTNPIVLEIGFGMGDCLGHLCVAYPHINFIGVEVFSKGMGALLAVAHNNKLTNIKVFNGDVVQLLSLLATDSLDKIQVFFPDPWHKKRHQKRRLLSCDFLANISSKLQPKGVLHIKTDWLHYACEIAQNLQQVASLTVAEAKDCPFWLDIPKTKFQIRGEKLGHIISEFAYQKLVI